MENIEVSIIAKHIIKPSTSSSLLQPYKLSLLDQLTPAMYVPVIVFLPIPDLAFDLPQTLAHLRKAFSETLTLYYPFSGRVKNNLYIDDFEAGVPYVEARLKCAMTDFLKFPKLEWLDKFVPLKPTSMEVVSDEAYPLVGVQVNIFESGIAIGICTSHKLIDGLTAMYFLKSWGAIITGRCDKIIHPNLSQAALLFPPREDLPEKYATLMEGMWFAGKKVATRRFVFDSKAISRMQDEAESEFVPKPSRVQSLIGFLWKHMIAASLAITSDTTTSTRLIIANQAVNLRTKMGKDTALDNNAIGNLTWWAQSLVEFNDNAQDKHDLKLCDLVKLLNQSVQQCDSDYIKDFTGKEGYENMCEYLDNLKMMGLVKPAPEIYSFSSWTTFGEEDDSGSGGSLWIGLNGKIESGFSNFTILVPTMGSTGIEAWVNLEEAKMIMLEQDPQFLRSVSPKPLISRY